MTSFSEQQKKWKSRADKELEVFSRITSEGIPIDPVYTHEDVERTSVTPTLPGFFPYTRGVYPTMYRGRPWTIRQYAGFSTAEESNAFYHQALKQGQKGLSIAFDLATHRGFDSDHPSVEGDVGQAGVAIDSVEDMKILLQGVPLAEVSVSMTMNGAVLPILASFIVAGEESGVSRKQLSGTIQNDILKEYMVRNTYIYPPHPSMRIIRDIISYTAQQMPRFNSISISGYHLQEAGANAAQELAYTLADGLEYVELALRSGLSIDDFAPRLSFFFGIGMNFFMEIAKLRAAREMWAEMIQKYKPQDPRSLMLRTHCQTSGYSLTAQDPYNNIIRTTVEALASILGGTQSLHTNAFDEALALPSDLSARIARNTQLILQEETDITFSADPLGGSYLVETLTKNLKEKAQDLMSEIQTHGGMTKAILAGIPQKRISDVAAETQARIDRGEKIIIGLNKYPPPPDEKTIPLRTIKHQHVIKEQKRKLTQLKKTRSQKDVDHALASLKKAAESSDANLLEHTVHAMQKRATLGEVSDVLAQVFGRHHTTIGLSSRVYGGVMGDEQLFQKLLARTHLFAQTQGRPPRMLLVKLGQDGHDRGIKVVAAAFSDVGFDVELSPLFQTPEQALRLALDGDPHVIGISSQAGAHKILIPKLIKLLKHEKMGHVLIAAGGVIPEDDHSSLLDAGVSLIFTPGSSLLTCVDQVLTHLERASTKKRSK